MKFNTLQRYDHSVDYYNYRTVSNGAGNEFEYFYERTIKCQVFTDTAKLLIYVPEPLRIQSQIKNIRDKGGELLVGAFLNDEGWTYQLTSVDPVLNAFGYRDALRYTATRV